MEEKDALSQPELLKLTKFLTPISRSRAGTQKTGGVSPQTAAPCTGTPAPPGAPGFGETKRSKAAAPKIETVLSTVVSLAVLFVQLLSLG